MALLFFYPRTQLKKAKTGAECMATSIFMTTFDYRKRQKTTPMEPTMYDMLMHLPLFQGMSRSELFEVIEQAVFHFRKVGDGRVVVEQGERGHQLIFLMSGELVSETCVPDAHLTFSETFTPYMAIEPHSLFGKQPAYKATYRAKGEVSLLSIDKRYVHTLLGAYEVFRINLINMLSSKIENQHKQLWSIGEQELEGRVARLIRSLCTIPQGPKVLNIKMEDLARLLDDTRLNVSRVLNKWHAEGLITMRRKEFVVHDIARLP